MIETKYLYAALCLVAMIPAGLFYYMIIGAWAWRTDEEQD